MTDSGSWFQMGTQQTNKEDWYNVVLANGVRRGMEYLVLGLGQGFGVRWKDGITEWPNKILLQTIAFCFFLLTHKGVQFSNWCHFTYSHFAYLLLLGAISPFHVTKTM